MAKQGRVLYANIVLLIYFITVRQVSTLNPCLAILSADILQTCSVQLLE